MSSSTNNSIPFVPENTIDPAAGLNESINTIDALLQLAVLTVNSDIAPSSPAEGDRHIVGPAPTGAWAGNAGKVARFLDGYWSFYAARLALNLASGILYTHTGTTWSAIQAESSIEVNGAAASALAFAGAGVTVTDNGDGTATITIPGGGGGGGGAVSSVAGRTGDVLLEKSDVNLDRVDNTSDAEKPVSSPQAAALGLKVDKVMGFGLSQESFTTGEKTKLAGLDGNHYRGTFVSFAAMASGVVSPIAGDYADVDAGAASDVIRYIWDVTDAKWVGGGIAPALTAAQVKTLYESNPDTNAYNNAARDKLGGIEAGAQANAATNISIGARTTTTVQVLSSTGSAATLPGATQALAGLLIATDKTKLDGVAPESTKNQTDDFLRARENHTGTQAIGTVSGLQAAIDSKQDALASGLNIKTVNGESLLGAGNIVVGGGGGGGGLTLFEESRSVATPNATVPVHALTALGAETNIDFVIAPKGTGAFSLHVPDNTVAGGNKRGAGAVDLQTSRSSAIQVASGARSLVSGRQCRASAPESLAVGSFCVATQSSAIAMGSAATASGQNGSVALGSDAASLGNGSAAIGSGVTASGDLSLATGGNTTTRGVTGAVSEGVSPLNAQGQTQAERILQRFDTPGVTPTQLVSGQYTGAPTAANSATMPNNSAYYCRLRVLARNTATNESMSWSGTALIKRGANAASTTLIGSTIASDFGDAAMSACTVTLSADTTRGALAVTVTGLASTTIRWVAQLETVEAA